MQNYILILNLKTHFHILDKPIKFAKYLPQICFTEQPPSLFLLGQSSLASIFLNNVEFNSTCPIQITNKQTKKPYSK